MATAVDTRQLEAKVKQLHRQVAEEPAGGYHFDMGRPPPVSASRRSATTRTSSSRTRARKASARYGVKSISMLAVKAGA